MEEMGAGPPSPFPSFFPLHFEPSFTLGAVEGFPSPPLLLPRLAGDSIAKVAQNV